MSDNLIRLLRSSSLFGKLQQRPVYNDSKDRTLAGKARKRARRAARREQRQA